MKKKLICLTGVIFLSVLLACDSQNLQTNSEDFSVVNPSEFSDNLESSEDAEIKKEFTFLSAEDVENISDEDLVIIASGDYTREDFFKEGSYANIDLFGVEMMEPTEENPENTYESIRIDILDIEELGENHDINELISAEFLKEYGAIDVEYFIDSRNTRTPGQDTGSIVKDKEIIYCGDTDYYVEYSGRYTDCRSMYSNDVLVTHNIPRAYRFVYMRTFAMCDYDNGYRVMMLGELNKDYVQQQLDYYMSGINYFTMVYREMEETEESYIYTYYYVLLSHGDWGINDEAVLYMESITVDKETHILYENYSYEPVKSVEIFGTAPSCVDEY